MATDEQKAASKKVMDAVVALNTALLVAGGERIHIELKDIRSRDMIVRNIRSSLSRLEKRCCHDDGRSDGQLLPLQQQT